MVKLHAGPIGLGRYNHAAGAYDASHLTNGGRRVVKVHEDTLTVGSIERPVPERQLVCISGFDGNDGAMPASRGVFPCLCDERISVIYADNATGREDLLREARKEHAIAAADFKNALAWLEIQKDVRVLSDVLHECGCRHRGEVGSLFV